MLERILQLFEIFPLKIFSLNPSGNSCCVSLLKRISNFIFKYQDCKSNNFFCIMTSIKELPFKIEEFPIISLIWLVFYFQSIPIDNTDFSTKSPSLIQATEEQLCSQFSTTPLIWSFLAKSNKNIKIIHSFLHKTPQTAPSFPLLYTYSILISKYNLLSFLSSIFSKSFFNISKYSSPYLLYISSSS